MSRKPVKPNGSAPDWVQALVRKHLPSDWRIVWRTVSSTAKIKASCWLKDKVIQFHFPVNYNQTHLEYTALHEIAHGLRGVIPVPSFRRKRISHDENFFRIAAKLYIEFDLERGNVDFPVLTYSAHHEYRSGRHVMESALRNVYGFIADPFNFPLKKEKRQYNHSFGVVAFEAKKRVNDRVQWADSLLRDRARGIILKVNRKCYKVKLDDGRIYRVPFRMIDDFDKEMTSTILCQISCSNFPKTKRVADRVTWISSKLGRIVSGTVLKINRTRYKVQLDDGRIFSVPFEIIDNYTPFMVPEFTVPAKG